MAGAQRAQDHLQAFVIPDERITASTLKARGAGATDSAYTEQSPKTGQPEPAQTSDLVLKATGDQSQEGHLEVLTRRAGHPTPEHGGYVWRDVDAGDSTGEYKGHDVYNAVTGWDPIIYAATDVLEPHLNVIRLASGKLLATGIVDSAGNYEVRQYDPSTSTWSAGIDTPVDDATNTRQSCLVQLSEVYDSATEPRVLLFIFTADQVQIDVYRSDDEGATWAPHAYRVCTAALLDTGGAVVTPERMSAAYNNGQICLAFDYVDSTPGSGYAIQQLASSDNGGTLVKVGETPADTDAYARPSVVALPGGGFLIGCWTAEPTSNAWVSLRIPSAFDLFTAGDYVNDVIVGEFVTQLDGAYWIDEDSTIWALAYIRESGTPQYEMQIARSIDLGASWTAFNLNVMCFEDVADYLNKFDCASTFGRGFILTRWVADPTRTFDDESVCAVELGGYSEHTLPDSTSVTADYFKEVNALAWGDNTGSAGTDAGLYLPIQLPGTLGWGAAGVGTESLTATTGDLQVVTTGGQTRIYTRANTGQYSKIMLDFEIRVASGGDDTTNRIALGVRLADNGSYEIEVEVRFDSAGFRVYDVAGTAQVGSPVVLDMTTKRHIRVALEHFTAAGGSGEVYTWYGDDAHTREWTEGPNGTTVDAAVTANTNRVRWGHLSASAEQSFWTMVGYNYRVNGWAEDPSFYSIFASNWQNPECLNPRAYSVYSTGIFDDVRLLAESGPARVGETWDIHQDSDYRVEYVDPRVSASPAQRWRSVDDGTQVAMVWDAESVYTDEGYMDNSTIVCFVLGANFKEAHFEGYNGAAWVQIGFLDAAVGFKTLGFDRRGRKLQPSAGSAAGDRYFFHEAYAGDHFDLGALGSDGSVRYVKIAHNTEGGWKTSSKDPTIILDPSNLNGNEVTTGTGALWRRDFGIIVNDYTAEYDQFRLRIPVQTTAEGWFEAGNVVIGPASVLGIQYDRGYAWTSLNTVSVVDKPSGGMLARKDGPTRREFTFALAQNAVDLTQCNANEPSPDFRRAHADAEPVATLRDTTRMLDGVIRRAKGAETPVLLLTAIPYVATGQSTTTDENRAETMLWGRVVTDLHRTVMLGDEGDDEVERYQTITMVEEV